MSNPARGETWLCQNVSNMTLEAIAQLLCQCAQQESAPTGQTPLATADAVLKAGSAEEKRGPSSFGEKEGWPAVKVLYPLSWCPRQFAADWSLDGGRAAVKSTAWGSSIKLGGAGHVFSDSIRIGVNGALGFWAPASLIPRNQGTRREREEAHARARRARFCGSVYMLRESAAWLIRPIAETGMPSICSHKVRLAITGPLCLAMSGGSRGRPADLAEQRRSSLPHL